MASNVLICGGRDFDDFGLMFSTLELLHAHHRFKNIMQGGARGADAGAKLWARQYPRDITIWECRAEWDKYGRAAGPIRNKKMLLWQPELVIAFPTGGRGTKNMMKMSRDAGIEVMEFEPC